MPRTSERIVAVHEATEVVLDKHHRALVALPRLALQVGEAGAQVVKAGRVVVLEEVPGRDEVLLGGVTAPCEGNRGVTGREGVGWGGKERGKQVVEAGRVVVLEEVPGRDEVLLGGVTAPCEGDREG